MAIPIIFIVVPFILAISFILGFCFGKYSHVYHKDEHRDAEPTMNLSLDYFNRRTKSELLDDLSDIFYGKLVRILLGKDRVR